MNLTELQVPGRVTQTSPKSPLQFQFAVSKLVHVPFTCQEVTLPDITANVPEQASPFAMIKQTPNRVSFGALQITFQVDERLHNYKELYRWLVGLAHPGGFQQYTEWAEIVGSTNPQIIGQSDATLTVLDSNNQPILRFRFPDIFPIAVGSLRFSTTETDVVYLTCTASFAVTIFGIEDLALATA